MVGGQYQSLTDNLYNGTVEAGRVATKVCFFNRINDVTYMCRHYETGLPVRVQ